MVLDVGNSCVKKLILNIELTPYTKINTKLIIDLNAKLRKFWKKTTKNHIILVLVMS